MQRLALIVFFAVILIGSLIAWMPAAFVMRQLDPAARGVSYDRVSGTIWAAQISGLRVAGEQLGDASLQLRPGDLLSGRIGARFAIDGPSGQLRGSLKAAPSGAIRLTDTIGDVNVHALQAIDPVLRRSPAQLNLSVRTLALDSAGRCRQADGALQTDLLVATGQRWNWAGPVMAGTISCDGARLAADLSSSPEDGTEQVMAGARLDLPTRLYEVTALVETEDRQLADVLVGLDFVREGDGFVFRRSNRPQTASNEEMGN